MNSQTLFLYATAVLLAGAPPVAAGAVESVRLASREVASLTQWDTRIETLLSDGSLRLRRSEPDTLISGRTHERLQQLHEGVPVFGAELVRQRQGGGTSLSLFGTLHTAIEVDPQPVLTAQDARDVAEKTSGAKPGPRFPVQLFVLPLENGGYALTYRVRVFTGSDLLVLFIDAGNGSVALRYSALESQSVGDAEGVHGDRKKLSGEAIGGGFVARDRFRPPAIETFDMAGDFDRTLLFFNGYLSLDDSDLASSSDNVWRDGANVDAHVYAGYVYDYLYQRFGRRGLDDADIPITSIVHAVDREDIFLYSQDYIDLFYLNAFYLGEGIMVYGEGLPEDLTFGGATLTWFSAAIDVVAHELTHGVTDYSSQLIYQNESGALNESFSDILATGVEFFAQEPGNGKLRADYLLGEDLLSFGAFRSLANPQAMGDPDHYSVRYTGSDDNGGVHINSSIVNHAFYLAIEGGTNRVSGLSVNGVGPGRREEIERVFYRAFVFMLPPDATFSVARAATIQAAVDLYGGGSDTATAMTQAWNAVGVN